MHRHDLTVDGLSGLDAFSLSPISPLDNSFEKKCDNSPTDKSDQIDLIESDEVERFARKRLTRRRAAVAGGVKAKAVDQLAIWGPRFRQRFDLTIGEGISTLPRRSGDDAAGIGAAG
ncbi:hypothetical protein [Isosphaera pallida]|uniref:hypothetical protein n=1 Tax=Isosphaera pallida TaxID=128 RepID=UPI0002FDEA76